MVRVGEPRADRDLARELVKWDGEEVREGEATRYQTLIYVSAVVFVRKRDREILTRANFD